MPLRDHFRPPVSKKSSWEGFHALWPACIVQQLRDLLPAGYVAEPRVRLGTYTEIGLAALEDNDHCLNQPSNGNRDVAVGMSTWRAAPAVAVDTEPPDEYEYEVRVFGLNRERQLVAAIEFVSPANKDRPESRESFVVKCASLLRKGVAVSVIDLVTIRKFNLYAQLMEFVGHPDPTMSGDAATYAASCRWPTRGVRARLEAWSHALHVGEALPILPLWLDDALVVPLDLEPSYEAACHTLWIS